MRSDYQDLGHDKDGLPSLQGAENVNFVKLKVRTRQGEKVAGRVELI